MHCKTGGSCSNTYDVGIDLLVAQAHYQDRHLTFQERELITYYLHGHHTGWMDAAFAAIGNESDGPSGGITHFRTPAVTCIGGVIIPL